MQSWEHSSGPVLDTEVISPRTCSFHSWMPRSLLLACSLRPLRSFTVSGRPIPAFTPPFSPHMAICYSMLFIVHSTSLRLVFYQSPRKFVPTKRLSLYGYDTYKPLGDCSVITRSDYTEGERIRSLLIYVYGLARIKSAGWIRSIPRCHRFFVCEKILI